jgi:hypothetical protein
VRQDLLEHLTHVEVVCVALVVIDVAPRDGGLIEVPDERLLAKRQRREPVGVELHDRGVVHALEQVLPFSRRRRLRLDGRRRVGSVRSARGGQGKRHDESTPFP